MENVGKNFKADVVRHGETKYEQGSESIPIEEAEDLTDKGIEQIRESAEKIAETIEDEEEVRIWSSPTGRTLHSAKIISEVLQSKGKHVKLQGGDDKYGVRSFEQFGEARNFSWELFEPLMNGGEVEFQGKTFHIDKALTNPNDLEYPEYFIKDASHDIPQEVKEKWPEEYVKQVEGFEKFTEITNRMLRNLERASKAKDKNYRVIIVTHDALTGFMASVFTQGEKQGLTTGEFINLARNKEGGLSVTQVGDVEDGDSESDVIDRFKEQ